MARRIVDEEMRFTIIINGNPAQKQLHKVQKATDDLIGANKKLHKEKARLERQGKTESARYKEVTSSIKKNTVQIKKNHQEMDRLEAQIGVTGLTFSQLRKKAAQLRLALRHMVPGSAEANAYEAQLKQINIQLAKMNMRARTTGGALSNLSRRFNRYAALGASVIASITGVLIVFQKLIDLNGELSDAQSDVQKTTGLLKEEVAELTKEFGLFKTRTARIELLKLAEEAGRLGIEGKKNVLAFVETANMIKVALGDDLSETQIREVGKIADIYKIGEKNNVSYATSFEAIGSAINEVSASGANQAGFLVEYLKRTSGIAIQTDLTAEANLGYAATFDEIGQSVEVAGTMMNKVFMDMFNDTKTYSEIAGMTEESFKKLLNTDANEAMLRFLEGLNGNGDGFTVMLGKIGELEAGGARGIQALSALASATDKVREKQEVASNALQENTSLANEYALKNENLQASILKIQKRLVDAFTSESIITGLSNFFEWFSKFIGASEDADGKVTKFRNKLIAFLKTVVVLTVAIISYNTAVKLTALFTNKAYQATRAYVLLQKINAITTGLATGATLLLKAAYFALTGNITKATAAMRLFSRVAKLSPIGLIVGLIGAATAAYLLFAEKSKEAATAQSIFNETQKEAKRQTAEEIAQKEIWLRTAKNQNLSYKERQKAVDKLNETVPEYNNQLEVETVNTLNATETLEKHTEALINDAKATILAEKIRAKAIEIAKLESSSIEENIEWYENLWNTIKSGGQPTAAYYHNVKTGTKNRLESIEANKEELKILKQLHDQQLEENQNANGPVDLGPQEGDTKTVNGKVFIYKNGKWVVKNSVRPPAPDDKKKSPFKSNLKDVLAAQQAAEDAKISLIQDSFKREMAQNDANYKFKIKKLQEQLVKESELKKLQRAIDAATARGDNKEVKALETIKLEWLAKNNAINSQIESQNQIHENKKAEIIKKGIERQLKEAQDQFKQEELEKEIFFQQELAKLGKDEDARKALKEKHHQEKLQRQKEQESELLEELQQILDSAEFRGFDLEILTEEQKEAIKTRLVDLGLSLAQIEALLAGMSGKSLDGGIDLGEAGNTDLFGFTADDWLNTFTNIDSLTQGVSAAAMAVQGFANAWGMYHKFVQQNQQQELRDFEDKSNKKKKALDRQLDQGFISRKQYDAAVEGLDKQLEKRKAKLAYETAKRQKFIALASAISGTAQAVIGALGNKPWTPANIGLSALVGSLGALNIALIAKQKLPAKGYEQGYYGNTIPVQREQDGKLFNASYGGNSRSGLVDKPTVFLAGEQGKNFPELIINGNDLKQFHPDLKQSLYREIGRVRGFQEGYYGQSQNNQETAPGESDEIKMLLLQTMQTNTELLEFLKENGVTARMSRDFRDIKELDKDLNDYQKLLKSAER